MKPFLIIDLLNEIEKWPDPLNQPGIYRQSYQVLIEPVRRQDPNIEQGSPWENGYVESSRYELLDREIFITFKEAKVLKVQWRREYNQVRLHSTRNNRPPAPEAIMTVTLT